jgi:hypothetical protein
MIKHSGQNVTAGILLVQKYVVRWLLRDITYGNMRGSDSTESIDSSGQGKSLRNGSGASYSSKIMSKQFFTSHSFCKDRYYNVDGDQESVVPRRTCRNAIIYSIARTLSK